MLTITGVSVLSPASASQLPHDLCEADPTQSQSASTTGSTGDSVVIDPGYNSRNNMIIITAH
ncbi:filamentous hemagglutinin family protein [Klebsiella variicola]|nr:filamentous hemagglutinin family protein [Klebsiella variicola]